MVADSGPTLPRGAGAYRPGRGNRAGGLGQASDQPLPQALVVQALLISEKDQIDVGAVVELAAAQLAHRQHGETVEAPLRLPCGNVQAGAHDAVSQVRELRGHRGQIEQTAQVAQADAQELALLEAQAVEWAWTCRSPLSR